MSANPLQEYVRLIIEAIRTKKGQKHEFGDKFSLEKFKKIRDQYQMRRYAHAFLQSLGEGSSRVAFVLSGKYALKIAKSTKGTAQNEAELEIFTNPKTKNVLAKIYAYDHEMTDWLISDLVSPFDDEHQFESATGTSFSEFCAELRAAHLGEERSDMSPLVKGVNITAEQNGMSLGDICKIDSWGKTPDGRCVLLDYGLTHEVWESHYSQDEPKSASSDAATAGKEPPPLSKSRHGSTMSVKSDELTNAPKRKGPPPLPQKTSNVRSDELEPDEDPEKTRR